MPQWLLNLKFYCLVVFHSLKHLFYHFVNNTLHPNRFKLKQKFVIPPKCLSQEENGSHRYAKLSRTKLHYVEKGNRNNPLLLLLHGYPEFWYSWRFQLRSLSSYYWVVALDMKGSGDSDKPAARKEYDITVLVNELHDFITALGAQKCSIVTHGFGGLVAWYYQNEYPDTVENFISIGSPHPISFLQELFLGRVADESWYYFCPTPHFPEKEAMKQDLKLFDKTYARMLSSKRGNMTQQDLEAFKYTFSRIEDWIGPINCIRTLLLRQNKYKRPLRKSKVPTLFIIGNCDPNCSLEMICKSSEYVENFTLKIVEGGGHFLPQEMPNYINSLILDFLKSNSIIWFLPEPPFQDDQLQNEGSIIRKMFGAGKTVVNSTVNYGNQVWTTSKDALSIGYSTIPKKISSS